jgi:hypothetical protein
VVPGALLRWFIDGANHSLDAQRNLGIYFISEKKIPVRKKDKKLFKTKRLLAL